eukprot:CAMPEP_0181186490 /NCGR_PEP_ID=MMETSP1096-20121128/10062_1 /TAXON_ID=156174 ORGANISM="Chrysochromulina ericina, Strain CCMP281" /NCGR_SAMPLE_ID=MMETSP1096 /ASSEMBLY_ACC=CAM_ASM_000453 /LENGTH=72 /DNA_ID=CAMNT_0023275391 /DNA_START=1121 /DNA_END=1339 /DNA_ORIENTATION=-
MAVDATELCCIRRRTVRVSALTAMGAIKTPMLMCHNDRFVDARDDEALYYNEDEGRLHPDVEKEHAEDAIRA